MPIGLLPQSANNHNWTPITNEAEFRQAMKELSNWGRWGPDDELGASNLITPAKRKQAAALVKEGLTISLAHDVIQEEAADAGSRLDRVAAEPNRHFLIGWRSDRRGGGRLGTTPDLQRDPRGGHVPVHRFRIRARVGHRCDRRRRERFVWRRVARSHRGSGRRSSSSGPWAQL
jgi:hypothetical protein